MVTENTSTKCECLDWTCVGYQEWCYWPDGHPEWHHPDCKRYKPPLYARKIMALNDLCLRVNATVREFEHVVEPLVNFDPGYLRDCIEEAIEKIGHKDGLGAFREMAKRLQEMRRRRGGDDA